MHISYIHSNFYLLCYLLFSQGGAIGIGKACTEKFAQEGYHVVITDILDIVGEKLANDLQSKGLSVEFQHLNVKSTVDSDALLARILEIHGHIDCIIANAGIAHRVKLEDLSDEKWDETMEVDLKGMVRK